MNGKQLDKIIRDTFKLEPDQPITVDQLNYVLGIIDPVSYILQHHTINGKPITFTIPDHDTNKALGHRPWQMEMLRDMSQNMVVIKSRQLGLSELGVEQMIHWLDTHSFDRVTGLYTFPTYKQLKTFFKQRIMPEFDHGYYKSLIKDPKQTTQEMMMIRDSSLVFRSSSQGSAMEGLKIDFLSLDEYDRLNPLAEQSAVQSMQSSKYKMMRRWSTPTVQDYGIHKLYMQSDQRKWFHKCSHCGYEQVLDYDKNIKQINPDGIDVVGRSVQPGTFQFVCVKCGKPLDRWYSGHWVTTAPGSGRIHGYQISQMDAVWVSADKLKEEEMRAPSKQFFYNYSLGFPYEDKGATFRPSDIFSHVDDFEKPNDRENYKFVSVGIDWGEHYHSIVTMGMRPSGQIDLMDLTQVPRSVGVEHIEEDLNLVVRKINQYQPDIICADRGFSGNYVDKLIAYYGIDRVFGVIVRSAKSNGDFNAHFSSDNTVTIDKLTQNLITLGNIKRGDIRFWRGSQTDRSVQTLANHWGNVVIRTDEKEDEATHTIQYSKVILRKGAD